MAWFQHERQIACFVFLLLHNLSALKNFPFLPQNFSTPLITQIIAHDSGCNSPHICLCLDLEGVQAHVSHYFMQCSFREIKFVFVVYKQHGAIMLNIFKDPWSLTKPNWAFIFHLNFLTDYGKYKVATAGHRFWSSHFLFHAESFLQDLCYDKIT